MKLLGWALSSVISRNPIRTGDLDTDTFGENDVKTQEKMAVYMPRKEARGRSFLHSP